MQNSAGMLQLRLVEPLINRLPPEILGTVFEIVVLKPFQDTDVFDGGLILADTSKKWDWTVVTHVCRYWRKTAIRTTSLWTSFTKFRHIERTKTFLARSSVANLKVFFNLMRGTDLQYDGIRQLLLILRHIGLIEELHLRLPDSSGAMRGKCWKQILVSLKNPAPKLKHFSLLKEPYIDAIALPQLFSDTTPALQHVYLKGVDVRKHQSILHSLTTLRLLEIDGISHSQFIRLLEANPALKSFTLSYADRFAVNDIASRETLYFPSLLRLNLDGISPSIDDQIRWLKGVKFQNHLSWQIIRHSALSPSQDHDIRHGLFDALLQVPMKCKNLGIRIQLAENRQVIFLDGEIYPMNVQIGVNSSNGSKVSLGLNWLMQDSGDALWRIITSLVQSGHLRSAQLVHLDIRYTPEITDNVCRELLKEFTSAKTIGIVLHKSCEFGLCFAKILAEQPSVISSELNNLSITYCNGNIEDQAELTKALMCGVRKRKEMNMGIVILLYSGIAELSDIDIEQFSDCTKEFQYDKLES